MNRRQRLLAALAAAVAIAIVATLTLSSGRDESHLVASGTVEATEADLGFQVPGRIAIVSAREGDRVSAGSDLARLDQSELQARRQAATAQVEAARAVLVELRAGFREEEIAQGRAALRAADQRLVDARRDLDRARRLFDGGAVSQQDLERQATALELALADVDQAKERLRILETGPRPERIAAQRAALAQATAAVAQIDAMIDQSVVRAPFDGIVTVRHREPGETAPAGVPVLTLMNPEDRWVRIYLRADVVGRVAIGQRATITADSYDDRSYEGHVAFIASEAEFTPRNVQTTEERVKLVYEVRVRVTGDPSLDLKPGLAADVDLAPPST